MSSPKPAAISGRPFQEVQAHALAPLRDWAMDCTVIAYHMHSRYAHVAEAEPW